MTEEHIEKLKRTNIPEELWEYVYINEEGLLFSPVVDQEGNVIKTGEERYNDWKNKPVEKKSFWKKLFGK